jgi:hypothetical protein
MQFSSLRQYSCRGSRDNKAAVPLSGCGTAAPPPIRAGEDQSARLLYFNRLLSDFTESCVRGSEHRLMYQPSSPVLFDSTRTGLEHYSHFIRPRFRETSMRGSYLLCAKQRKPRAACPGTQTGPDRRGWPDFTAKSIEYLLTKTGIELRSLAKVVELCSVISLLLCVAQAQHVEIGGFGDYENTKVPTFPHNHFGLGVRADFHVHRFLYAEFETAYDFKHANFVLARSSGSAILTTSKLCVLHANAGMKLQIKRRKLLPVRKRRSQSIRSREHPYQYFFSTFARGPTSQNLACCYCWFRWRLS